MSSTAPDDPGSPIETGDLAALVRAALIGAGDVELDPVCIRDALWLAATMDTAEQGSATPASQPRIFRWFSRRRSAPRTPADAAGRPGSATEPNAAELFDVPDDGSGWTGTVRARRIVLGSPGALQGKLELARALRPFRQSWPSRHRMTLDVEATIRASAAARQTLPILRPRTERRFSVDLILDVSPSMLVWADAFVELTAVFAHVGAFRDVTTWQLRADEDTVLAGSRGPLLAARRAPVSRSSARHPGHHRRGGRALVPARHLAIAHRLGRPRPCRSNGSAAAEAVELLWHRAQPRPRPRYLSRSRQY